MKICNIFGFGPDWRRAREPRINPHYLSCDFHPGSILIKVKGEPMLQCSFCGTKYPDPNAKTRKRRKRKTSYPSQVTK